MAYGVGYPNGYPQQQYPQGIQPQQYINPYQQQYQPQQMPQNDGGIIWVQGEAGAKSYLVQPNKTVQLWDSEDNVIYLKSADASGMPSFKVLDYTIREQGLSNNKQSDTKSEFVTKSDLEEFGNKIMKQIEDYLK